MGILIENPYLEPGAPWLKGNLHTHTKESDGTRPPQQIIDDYAARGYDFLMLSDHDKLTDPQRFESRGMLLVPGNEISASGPHLLHVNAKTLVASKDDRQTVIDAILADHALAIVNHPNWEENFNHCPQENLNRWKGYAGIEVYNGVIRRLPGSPLASDRWDMLLAGGRRVWGFGNDDSHRAEEVALAWNVVQSKTRSVAAVCDAMARGSFYASTGVTIQSIAVQGRTIHLAAPNAQRIAVVTDFGVRRTHADATEITFSVPDDADYHYVRLECFGRGEAMAWTQPFFLKRL